MTSEKSKIAKILQDWLVSNVRSEKYDAQGGIVAVTQVESIKERSKTKRETMIPNASLFAQEPLAPSKSIKNVEENRRNCLSSNSGNDKGRGG